MTLRGSGAARSVITLVLRLWWVDAETSPPVCHIEATHVQTGNVTYLKTLEGLTEHIHQLARNVARPPIDLAEFRERSNHV